MLSREEFIRQSLEHNLFFTRIIKEHLIFAIAFLAVKNPSLVQPAMELKDQYETLLAETVSLSNQVVSREAIQSGEFVTQFTLNAELATQSYTGIPINTSITQAEKSLMPGMYINPELEARVGMLNQMAIALTTQAIMIKTTLGEAVKACQIFTFAYPTLLRHVLEEAKFYLRILNMLQRREDMHTIRSVIEHEIFWNHIMGQHAEFIRGLLDPSEKELMSKANRFAEEFEELTKSAGEALNQTTMLPQVTRESIRGTTEIRDFKAQGTLGILECKIKSIILPLLSDHVLREASHHLRMLRMFEKSF
ncbi:MAG: DUF2935 domain-containing protein [Clostridia bacterium]|nr:DUF2935 domain-containing protein [Clostridia bacterium]